MNDSTVHKIDVIKGYLKKADDFSAEFDAEIRKVVDRHKKRGGNLEYVYVEHFHNEIRGLSGLFQYLLKDSANKKYVFFSVRAAFEIWLQLEYVLRLAKLGGNEVLNLLSSDMAQSAAALNEADTPDENHNIYSTLRKIDIVNKILKTGFDLEKIKSNTRVFHSIRSLCEKSSLSLKDAQGADMYHVYVMYSESNHLRLSNHHSVSQDKDLEVRWALEYFIEIYVKFYDQLLKSSSFPAEFYEKLYSIKQLLGIK